MCLVCGGALAQDNSDEAKKKAAMQQLEKAFEQAKKTGITAAAAVEPEDPGKVQKGDLVKVNFTVSLEDGSLVQTTLPGTAKDQGRKWVEGYQERVNLVPQEVLAGAAGTGLDLESSVLGMKAGEKKTVKIPPEKAFGTPDSKKIMKLPCVKHYPRKAVLEPRVFVNQFGKFPVVGKEVDLTPYFKARVVEVSEERALLEPLIKENRRIEEKYGTVEIAIGREEITVTLIPLMGAPFEVNNQKGRITMTDGMNFTVDLNPPLAGKSALLDVEIVSLSKSSAFKGVEIAWVEDHDKGLEKAKKEGKPALLLLYAAWCSWSKKTLNETMEDPRIKMLKDQFVWVKVNSDEHKDIYEFYDQKGFPLVVLLNPNGDVIKKIDGYKEGGALAMELKNLVSSQLSVVRSQ